ncbi:MAG: DMT family transporter [Duodenibacillus sp.]
MLQSCWMLVAAVLFATMSALVKLSSGDAGTFEIVFYRSIIGLVGVSVLMLAQGERFYTRHLLGHFKRSMLGTISFTMWFSTMGHLPLGTATTLNYTAPLFIAATFIVTALAKRQKAPWLLGLAIAVGFAGVCLILQPSVNDEQLPWALIGLTAGAMGPIIFFQINQLGRLREPAMRIVFYFSLIGTVWGLLGCLIFEGGLKPHNLQTFVSLTLVGITALLAQLCLTRSYAYGNMMLTACFQFATIPFAEIISVVFFKETLPWTALCGMTLILIAGVSATILTKRGQKKPPVKRPTADDDND